MHLGKLEEMTHHHQGSLVRGAEKDCYDLINSCPTSPTPKIAPLSENANVVVSKQTDIFLCSFCDKKFQNKLRRDRHEKRHVLPVTPKLRCREANCGKLFATKATLYKHKRYVSCITP